jgi:hypothetical protein
MVDSFEFLSVSSMPSFYILATGGGGVNHVARSAAEEAEWSTPPPQVVRSGPSGKIGVAKIAGFGPQNLSNVHFR